MRLPKTILLTGANGILGQAYLRRYLELGIAVAAVDVKLDKVRKLSRLPGARLSAIRADAGKPADAKRAWKAALRELGSIDAVHHNCAGKPEGFFAPTEDYSLEAWRGVQASNLETALLLTQQAVPYFKRRHAGCFLFTSSIYGVVGADQRIYEGSLYEGRRISNPAAYSAAKAGVLGLMRHLACELGPWGIRSNALTPGGVSSGQNGVFYKKYSARVPMGRMARAEDMLGPALFLLSEDASYVNGHNLIVDGGLTAW